MRAIGICSQVGTERPRNFLLDFDHAQTALRLVVIKRHGKIMQEAEGFLAIPIESIQQIPGRGLFHPLVPRRQRNLRVELKPFPDESTVLEMEVRPFPTSSCVWPACRACMTSSFISRSRSFIFLAHGCLSSSSSDP